MSKDKEDLKAEITTAIQRVLLEHSIEPLGGIAEELYLATDKVIDDAYQE